MVVVNVKFVNDWDCAANNLSKFISNYFGLSSPSTT